MSFDTTVFRKSPARQKFREPSVTDGQAAISCHAVEKSFGVGETRAQVLTGPDFRAEYGEITFIVGPSGCGKTTLISILGGLLTPDAGEINTLGTDMRQLRGGALVDFRLNYIGFIFQQFHLIPTLTAVENAAVALQARGLPARRALQMTSQLLDQLGMGDQLNKYPHQMSGGQQQRVAIARALVHDPRIVICDEPTASLDAESGQNAMRLLKDMAVQSNRAVVVVTHDNRIEGFADRIAVMADGKVTENKRPAHWTRFNE
jgi:putative ABC transport system ATP-binding protein